MENIKEFPCGILDPVISLIKPDGENESVHWIRALSLKHQASSTKLSKLQAASFKPHT
jgi:hypothetical protein